MYDLGVIVARFQTPILTKGQSDLIDAARKTSRQVLVLLGVRDTPPTERNPLPFFMRERMIREKFSGLTVLPLEDMQSDLEWSKNMDSIIQMVAGPRKNIMLFHGRDSFVSHYFGKYPTLKFDYPSDSATDVRNAIASNPVHSYDFRAGMVYQMQHLQPRTYETVDMAITAPTIGGGFGVLLGKKKNENLLRFPGGFVNNNELTIEAARRELMEETGLDTSGGGELIGEFLIDDWRTRDTNTVKNRTFFYHFDYVFGKEKASDDLEYLEWVKVENDSSLASAVHVESTIMPVHRELFFALCKFKFPLKEELNV